jgi:PST family polysaccharide transporter
LSAGNVAQDPVEAALADMPAQARAVSGRSVAHGILWMLFSSGTSRLVTFAGQIILGRLLLDHDFGLFATALAISSFLLVLKDGGLRQLLIQRGRTDFERLAGPVFWMMAAFSFGSALVLAAAAPIVASAYGEKMLVPMLLVMAAAVVVSLPSQILMTGMYIDLRFDVLAIITTVSTVLKYVLAVGLAWMGVGAMSFVWPLLACVVFESAVALAVDRHRPWKQRPELAQWRGLLRDAAWLIIAALAAITLFMGIYPVIGLFTDMGTVGIYSFAFLLVSQTGMIAYSIEQVLFPSLSRLAQEPERRRSALLRSLQATAIIMVPSCLILAAAYEPFEQLVWQGKWAESVVPLQLLSLAYPLFILHIVSKSALLATGRFKASALMILISGGGLMAVGGVAAAIWGTPTAIAVAAAGYMALISGPLLVIPLKTEGVSATDILIRVAPTYLLTFAACSAAWLLDQRCSPASTP